jgi:hypothetical protein
MFCSDPVTLKARKAHVCTWCGQSIQPSETYHRWISVDDSMFTNKMHPECVDACHEELRKWNDDEYHPYDNERPATQAQPRP